MKRIGTIIVGLLLVGLSQTADSAENQKTEKTESGKGTTVDDLLRGLKSAEQNVEKEIPKIGSAVGETFKKITEKSSSKPAQETPPKDKK